MQTNSSDSQNTNASPNAEVSTNPNDHDEDGEEPPEERPIQLKRAHEEEQVIIHNLHAAVLVPTHVTE